MYWVTNGYEAVVNLRASPSAIPDNLENAKKLLLPHTKNIFNFSNIVKV